MDLYTPPSVAYGWAYAICPYGWVHAIFRNTMQISNWVRAILQNTDGIT